MDNHEWNLLQDFALHRKDAEESFAQLVALHGPLISGVCKRRLRDVHLAEDACQATFLVLARRAKDLKQHESLSNWLFGVALRTSAHVAASRQSAQRRELAAFQQQRQQQERTMNSTLTTSSPTENQQLDEVLDVALSRLPRGMREPLLLFVQCHCGRKTRTFIRTRCSGI